MRRLRPTPFKVLIKGSDIASAKWVHIAKYYQLQLKQKGGATVSFDGFREPDYDSVAK